MERLLKAAEQGGRMGNIIEILVLQALVHQSQGELAAALPPLARRAGAGRVPEGYVRKFVDEGRPAWSHCLPKPPRWGSSRAAGKLLEAFDAEGRIDPDDSPRLATLASQPLVEPLSDRELEVLRLIAQGLSNREISERLFLAVITVKGHNRNIFRKLQVRRRTEAIARARELGLL